MSDRDVDVNIRAQTADVEQGMARAADAIGRSTLLIREHFSRLGSVVESIKVPFKELAALLVGGEIFKDIVEETEHAGIELEKMAQKTGMATDELQKLRFAAAQSHVESGELDTSLVRLARTLESAAEGNRQAKVVFEALGIAVKDAQGNVRNLGDVLPEIAARFASYRDGTAKTAIAMQLFGRGGAEMIPILNKGRDGLREMGDEAQALGGVMGKSGVDAATQYGEAMGRVHTTIKGMEHEIGEQLLPILTKLADYFEAVLLTIKFNFEAIGGLVSTLFNSIQTLANGAGEAVRKLFHGDFAGAKAAIVDAATAADKSWSDTLTDIATKAKAADKELGKLLWGDTDGKAAGGTGNAPKLPGIDDQAVAKANIDAKKQEELAKLELEKDAIAFRREMHEIDADQELQQTADVLAREHAIKIGALKAELLVFADNEKEKARIKAEIAQEQGRFDLAAQKQQEKAATEYVKTWQHVADSVSASFSRSFETLIDHTGKLRDVMLKLGESIEHWLIESGFRQLTQHILIERAKTAATAEGSGQRTAISALAATKSLAIDIASGLKSIAIESVKAIARAWAAISAIPFVGPFLAPGVALATGASILALGGRIASASGGYDIPAGINPMTQLHAQEMVLPADLANVIRGMARGGGGMGGGMTVHIHAIDAQSSVEWARKNPQAIAEGYRAARRNGHLG